MAIVTINNGIPNKCAVMGQPFSFTIPNDAFSGQNIEYSAKIHRKNPSRNEAGILPQVYDNEYWWWTSLSSPHNWLNFSGDTFTGTPSNVRKDNSSIQILVRATDTSDGQYDEEVFTITMHDYVEGVTPTPMAKTLDECAYVLSGSGKITVDCKALGLQPGDTIGMPSTLQIAELEVHFNTGIKGQPIYLTNIGGKSYTVATNTNCWQTRGQYFKVLGQGTPRDPIGIDIRGYKNPTIQTRLCFHDYEFGYIKSWESGFSGISVKSQLRQRPGLSASKLVKYNGANPANTTEMNLISASENDWCIRTDAPNGDDTPNTRFIYRSGSWSQVDYSEIQIQNRTDRGWVNYSDLGTISNPQIGDYVYCDDVELFYIYNLCKDWTIYYDMVGVKIHDWTIEDTGTDGGTVIPPSAGESLYVGYGDYEATNNEGSAFFPNGTHDISGLRMHFITGVNIAYDALQIKDAPDKDNLIHHIFMKTYGIGTYSTIGVQDEGLYFGEGSSGNVYYFIAENHGPVSSNGIQFNCSNDAHMAFVMIVENQAHYGKIPIYGRKEGQYDGKTGTKIEIEFCTLSGFNGTDGNYDDLIEVISRATTRNINNVLFHDVPGLTRISGVTSTDGTVVFDGSFETGSYNPVSGNALTSAYYTLANAQDDKWLDISEGLDGLGRHIIRDPYGNIVDWDNLKVGAIQDSPLVVGNQPPIAVTGANQTITLPTNQITLDGSGSSDSDGTIVSYAWTKVSGGVATITSPSSASTTVTGLELGTYVFRLTITDNEDVTDFDDVTVIVSSVQVTGKGIRSMLMV